MTLVLGPNLSVDQTVSVPEVLKLAGGKGTNLAWALLPLCGVEALAGE